MSEILVTTVKHESATTDNITLASNGNVGIATSSPVAKLAVVGGTSNASNLSTAYSLAAFNITPKSTSGYSLQFGSGPADLPYIQMSAGGAASGNMTIQPYGGNVGIGTASPAQLLSVAGTVESTSGGFKFPDGTVQTTAGGAGVGAVAFARINQSTIISSYNISSVAVSGAVAIVTFATPLQDANYAPLVSPSLNSTAKFGNSGNSASTYSITASSFRIYGRGYTGSNNTTYAYGGVYNAMAIAVFR